MVTINRNSKPDTVLFLDFAAGNDEIDYSQYRTNITNNTTYLEETNSARTALDGPREITIVLDVTSGETGVLIDHGDGIDHAYRIDIVATNTVRCLVNGSVVLSAVLPGASGSDRRYVISWNQRLLTGSTYLGHLYIYDGSGTSSTIHISTSASYSIFAADPTHTLTIGAANGGASAFSGGLDFYYVRIGRRFHSSIEAYEDFVTESSPTAVTATLRDPPLVPDGDTLLALQDEDYFVGPGHLMAGYAIQQADRRLVCPLGAGPINTNPETLVVRCDNAFTAGSPGWWRLAPDDTLLRIGLPFLCYVPIPSHCNRVRVYAGVQQRDSSGATTCEIRWRAYSMAGLPTANDGIVPFSYHRGAQVTSTTEVTTVGSVTQLDLGSIGIAIDDWGCSWLTAAFGFKPGDALAATTTVAIVSLTLDPYYDPDPLAALDLALGA